jgi:hypothetical protein
LPGRDVNTGSHIEPISLLDKLPENPSLLVVKPFTEERIARLSDSFGSKAKVMSVLKEFTGLPSHVLCNFLV